MTKLEAITAHEKACEASDAAWAAYEAQPTVENALAASAAKTELERCFFLIHEIIRRERNEEWAARSAAGELI